MTNSFIEEAIEDDSTMIAIPKEKSIHLELI
jgi:hypothetical protein